MASGLLDKANIILTPTGYKAGTMYNVAPIESPYEDFDFARASVASRVNSSGLVEMVGRTLGSNLVQNGDFSEIGTDLVQNGTFDLGSELVTNGDFATDSDWSKTQSGNDTIVIENGYALFNCPDNSNIFITQSSVMTIGKTYTASFDIISIDSGGFQFGSGGGGTISGSPTANTVGTHTFTFVATTASFVIKRALGSPNLLNGKIDNVSVKEVPDWTLGTGWSVENNKAIYSGTANANLSQSGILTSSKQYKLEYEVISSTLVGGIVKLSGETASAQNVLSQSVGTHTLYFTADGTSPTDLNIRVVINTSGQYEITNIVVQELDPNDYWSLGTGWSIGDNALVGNSSITENEQRIFTTSVSRFLKITFDAVVTSGEVAVYMEGSTKHWVSTTGSYTIYDNSSAFDLEIDGRNSNPFTGSITNVSVQEVIDTNNIPRINYDSNGDNGHWLLEPTSTNEITYSEDFSQSDWSKTDVLIENGYTAPDGSNTAYKVTNNGANAHLKGYFGINTNKRKSIWAKTVSGSGDVYLLNANGINLFSLTNEWQRFDITHSGINNFFYAVDFRGASTTLSEVIIWGCQLEDLSYATSYIPTLTGSTETRATETATGAGSADLINSTEGVLYAEIAALADDGTIRYISIDDGSTNNRITIFYQSNNKIRTIVEASDVIVFDKNYTVTDITDFHKVAVKWKANDFALWVDGLERGTSSSGSAPSGLNELVFELGGSPFYGKCKALTVYNTALTDAELTELTS